MSGKHHVLALVTVLAVAAIVGCSGGTTTIIHSPGSSPARSPSPGSDSTTPASSSAVDKAKEQAVKCIDKIGSSGLVSSAGRTELADCLENFERLDDDISSDEDDAFEHCLIVAAANDKVWTSEGRTRFTNTSVPDCLNQVRSGDDDDDDGDD
jgi:hypothetical protein